MKKILVIGGTRYLGLEIVRRLANQRSEKVYVLNRGVTKAALPDDVQSIVCDIGNLPCLVDIVNDLEPDCIIDNIMNDDALSEVLGSVRAWLKRFIHTGSIGVYGDTTYLPAREDDGPNPELPAFRQKLAQDEVVMKHIKKAGLPGTILRVSYIYGRGDVPLELWGGRNPEFYRRLLRGEEIPIPGDGMALLHPGHVTDLASAFMLALENDASIGQVYNVAGDRSITLKKYLDVIGNAMGVAPRVVRLRVEDAVTRLVDDGLANKDDLLFAMEHMAVDITKAKNELGYIPAVGLEEGMKDNIRWMREEGLIGD